MKMKKVIIASENPVKVTVAKRAFSNVFPYVVFEFTPIKSESSVPDKPMNEETERGALNRLNFIKERQPDADYWISVEGGTYSDGETLYSRTWVMVGDREGYIGKSSTASVYLPAKIVAYIKNGLDLGTATDDFFSSINSKHGIGVVGQITEGLIDRENYNLQAAIIALSELKHKDWYLN